MNRLRKGERVEVRSDENGFLGSWYEATLLKKSNKSCWVRYRTLVGENSSAPLEECVPLAQVRPVPPAIPRAATDAAAAAFEEGDAVEAYDRDGWWVGTITRVVEPDKYVVYFRESVEEMEYPGSQLRHRQDWHNGIWIRVYEKRNSVLESFRRKIAQPKYQVRGYSTARRLLGSNKDDSLQQGSDGDDLGVEHNQQEELNDGVPLVSPPSDHTQDNVNSRPPSSPQGSRDDTNASDRDSPRTRGRKRKDPDKSDPDHRESRTEADGTHAEDEQLLAKGAEENSREKEVATRQEGKGGPEEDYCMVKYIQRKAYSCVLRALRSKCHALTWTQEQLITDLRKHLEINNDIHIKQLELLDAWQLDCRCKDCCS